MSNNIEHDELQYLNLIDNVIKNGAKKVGRNNAVTYSIFGHMSRYSLRDNTLPVITTKKMFLRGIIEELLWILRGSTNANELKEKNIHIWDGHTSKEHYQSCGLDYEEGDTGPLYGMQWRHSGAEYKGMREDYTSQGVDQIKNVIEQLKNNPNSRRHVVCSWNPSDLPKMVLPPCHCLFQFYVNDNGLSCTLYQRSGDIGLGIPFNITSYSLLTHFIANELGIPANEFIHVIGDAHVYEDHIPALQEQLKRQPKRFPKVRVISNTDQPFLIENYESHGAIKMKMVV